MYEIKFMFADAKTIEESFEAGSNIQSAKAKLVSNWPADRDPVSGPDDLKLIYNGKILESNKSFEDYKVPLNNQVIMHIQPRLAPVPKAPASSSQEQGK
mmetsp:Transcript_32527/g.73116  ORF Transcript_32527/g.73116 Transcript_32527/m.73116 type:complete len:99 (+) Transcript_32527:188-484(+)